MDEKMKNTVATLQEKYKAIPKKIKILVASVLLTLVVVAVVVTVVLSNRPYSTLFTGLSQEDLTGISTYFSENGITQYKVEDDTILVPADQEATLKAQVLVAGYPSSGYGYDTYLDNVGSLTTESERNQLTLYGLQDRIAAVIRNFEGVKDAVVFLTPGEQHTYVLDNSAVVDATAAVQVTMQSGKTLDDKQVQAIRNLVSRSLAGLNVENVEITDTYGNSYSASGELGNMQNASDLKMKLEEQCNNNIRTRIMQALSPLYGEDNVQVSVTTTVDVDKVSTDSTDYSLEDWAQGADDGIIGSEVWNDEIVRNDQNADDSGVAGTSSNADLDTYVEEQAQPDGTESTVSTSGQKDHLVDTQKQQTERVAGYISDVMVSVTINQDVAGNVNQQSLYDHVARAAGISQADQAQKISILVAPFYNTTQQQAQPVATAANLPGWTVYVIAGVAGLVFLLMLVLILVYRHKAKKYRDMEDEEEPAEETPGALDAAAKQADIMEMKTEKSMELRQEVRQFANDNPEIAAQMVKNWLKEGE